LSEPKHYISKEVNPSRKGVLKGPDIHNKTGKKKKGFNQAGHLFRVKNPQRSVLLFLGGELSGHANDKKQGLRDVKRSKKGGRGQILVQLVPRGGAKGKLLGMPGGTALDA